MSAIVAIIQTAVTAIPTIVLAFPFVTSGFLMVEISHPITIPRSRSVAPNMSMAGSEMGS